MSALKVLLENYRQTSKTEREKGTYQTTCNKCRSIVIC